MRYMFLAAILIAACAGAPSTSVAPTVRPTPAATTTPTAPPTVAPTATPTSAPAITPSPQPLGSPTSDLLDLCTGGRESCELAAGTYSPSLTTPKMTFTLQEGWTGLRHYADGFSMFGGQDTILSFARDVTFGDASVAGLAGFEALLRSVSALRVADAELTTLGGLPAVQLDVVAVENAPAFITLDEDVYNLSQGQAARFIVLDIGGSLGMFIVESSTEASFDAAIATAQPVLDSVTFE